MTKEIKMNPKNQKTATDRFREEIAHSICTCFSEISSELKEIALRQLNEERVKKYE
jgi:hypothetical protein